jgi:ribosomal protein L11 methyltransferase
VTVPGLTPSEYIEAKIVVPREDADAVCDFITMNLSHGIVLEEEQDSPVTGITFYVPGNGASEYRAGLIAYLEKVFAGREGGIPEVLEKTIKNIEWVEEYKSSVRLVRIGDDIVVRPTWDGTRVDARYDITVEPKMAFGTGTHESTRCCLKTIRSHFRSGMSFLDFGCGSGIQSILASKMGARSIVALDMDLTAIDNCRENFEINKVIPEHELLFGSLEKCAGRGPFDFVCANILKNVILPRLERLVELTTTGGVLVLSGLLDVDEDEISGALRRLGQGDFNIIRDNQWLTYLVRKP